MGEQPSLISIMASLLSRRPIKKHVEYTSIETDAIINGVKILGDNPGRWAEIKRIYVPIIVATTTTTLTLTIQIIIIVRRYDHDQ